MKKKNFWLFFLSLFLLLLSFRVIFPKTIEAKRECGEEKQRCCSKIDENGKPEFYCNNPDLEPKLPVGEAPCICEKTKILHNVCQENEKCSQCLQQGNAWTALGCIPTNPKALVKWLFPYLLGLGGTIAFLLLILGGIQIMASAGNPDKVKAGKEQITAAIAGLVFIIFSLFILRFIGVDILQLPGLK